MPLHFSTELSMSWQISDIAAKVFVCAAELVVLCARAANLAAGKYTVNSLGQQDNLVTAWTKLAEDLASWHGRRPQECKPVAEVDGAGETFPIVLFTSGAGVLGNQLYHTAMLLLLQNRPRTIKLGAQTKPSSTMSALWHAQRICGIALNNDRRECWDPALVSSFVLAAKIMTHEAQHRAVLDGLDKIARLTGWAMDHHKAALRFDWGHDADLDMMNG
ncbi:hypothetical protein GQ53DRAFT_205930 [Thozetella sp. PMI_491]|nr:hypothetical protein GQ53DRAFT_205930 [Thozetella sp. PMI_491]